MMQLPKVQFYPGPNDAWREKRRGYITATEAASLFAMGNRSIAAVTQDKIYPSEPVKNEFMLIGNILEPAVLNAMHLRAGIKAEPAHPSKLVFITNDDCRLAATPDGKYIDEDGKFHLVECKTVGAMCPEKAKVNFNKWRDGVPRHYAIQVHTQMLVSRVDHAFIACMGYGFPLPLVVYYLKRHPVIEELLRLEAKRYWDYFPDKVFEPCKISRRAMHECLPQAEELHYLSHSWFPDE